MLLRSVSLLCALASFPAWANAQSQCGERPPGATVAEQRAILRASGVRGRSLRFRGAGWHVVEGRCLAIGVVTGPSGPLHVILLERTGRRFIRHAVGPDLWVRARLPCTVSEVVLTEDLDDDSVPDVRVIGQGEECIDWDPSVTREGEQFDVGEAIASGANGVLLWSGRTLEVGDPRWLTTEEGQAAWGGVHAIRRSVRRGTAGLEIEESPVLCMGTFDEHGLARTCAADGAPSSVSTPLPAPPSP